MEPTSSSSTRAATIQIMHVLSTARTPGWTYTIGLTELYGHPELVTSGLPPDLAQRVFNGLAARIRDGLRLREGSVVTDVMSHPLHFKEVPLELHGPEVGLATRHYGDKPFMLLQMVWPDPNDRYPWEPGHVDDPKQHCLWVPGGKRGHGRLRRRAAGRSAGVSALPRLAVRWDGAPMVADTH